MTLLRRSRPRARTRYACCACCMAIEAGAVHRASVYAGDGRVWTWREHAECVELADALDIWRYCSEAPEGYLTEYRLDDLPDLSGLSAAAVERWRLLHDPTPPPQDTP